MSSRSNSAVFPKRALVTGGAGFIGSNLCDKLLGGGSEVVVYDNLSTGRRRFLDNALQFSNFELVKADVLDQEMLPRAMEGCDTVFHIAANADVRYGLEHPTTDLEQNTVATSNVLEAMRLVGVNRIVFTSTGSVYGEPEVFPTAESCPFPVQTSVYGASKVGCEGLISAYCTGYGMSGAILRLVSILGERYTHGHVYDFYRSLKNNPRKLTVLGDGKQTKSYLYIKDLIDGMMSAHAAVEESTVEIYNIGTDETLVVDESLQIICQHLGVEPEITHTGGKRGWVGDSPLIHLDCSRLRGLGWKPAVGIADAVSATVSWFQENPWIFEEGEDT